MSDNHELRKRLYSIGGAAMLASDFPDYTRGQTMDGFEAVYREGYRDAIRDVQSRLDDDFIVIGVDDGLKTRTALDVIDELLEEGHYVEGSR